VAFSFFLGFALIIWPLSNETFAAALREAGSFTLTLGFVTTESPAATAVDFVAGSTGLIVIAVQIAYLPTLYGSFNRRETVVTMLQSRAGVPAWGPEILARAQQVGILGSLPQLYEEWERWAADVTESHTSYPVLIWFRSPHPLRSWIVGLVAVMDSAAMYKRSVSHDGSHRRAPGAPHGLHLPAQHRGCYADPVRPRPLPGRAHRADLRGVPRRYAPPPEDRFPDGEDAGEAWDHFRGWRVNYESVAYTIADSVVAPPGPWSGPRARLPNISIIPQRPANRSPDDKREDEPKAKRFGWHV
jgi:hypothetical protein